MIISGIYKIESKIKPKRIYIGSTINISNRKREHFRLLKFNKHSNIILQRHYNKYGKSDLHFSILLGCPEEDLIQIEQYFIDSYSPYFNICKYAGNTLGRKFSDETRKKMSIQRKGMVPWNKNKKGCHSPESIKKIVDGNREFRERVAPRKHSDETKKKISNSHMGINPWLQREIKHHSEETKKKIKETNIRTWNEKKGLLKVA